MYYNYNRTYVSIKGQHVNLKRQLMKYKLILIEWLDSKGITSQWEYLNEIKSLKPSRCFSTGFLIEETNHYKTIAQGFSASQVIGRMTIPKCAIQRITEIKL